MPAGTGEFASPLTVPACVGSGGLVYPVNWVIRLLWLLFALILSSQLSQNPDHLIPLGTFLVWWVDIKANPNIQTFKALQHKNSPAC